jgi:hypothetical protein
MTAIGDAGGDTLTGADPSRKRYANPTVLMSEVNGVESAIESEQFHTRYDQRIVQIEEEDLQGLENRRGHGEGTGNGTIGRIDGKGEVVEGDIVGGLFGQEGSAGGGSGDAQIELCREDACGKQQDGNQRAGRDVHEIKV